MNEEKYTDKDLKFKANERLEPIGMIGLTRQNERQTQLEDIYP